MIRFKFPETSFFTNLILFKISAPHAEMIGFNPLTLQHEYILPKRKT